MIYKRYRRRLDRYVKFTVTGIFLGFVAGLLLFEFPKVARANMIDPSAVNPDKIREIQTIPVKKLPARKEIEKYFPLAKTLFGSQWKIAIAVAEAECNSNRKDWPRCINSWGETSTTGEYSVGWGQINLARMGGKGNKVHWDKIPGDSLSQKTLWLQDPENNLFAMHLVWLGRGKSFSAWSAFTSGNYLDQLDRI